MALHLGLLRRAGEADTPPAAESGRRLSLTTYLQLDPAIRFVIALALVTAISLLYLIQTSSVTELNYDLQKAQVDHDQLVHDQQQLQLDIARAQSLTRIADVAQNNLHMVPAGDQYLYLSVPPLDLSGGAPGGLPATPAPAPDGGGGATP